MTATTATDDAAKEILAAYRLHMLRRDASLDLPAIAAIMVLRWAAWSQGPARGAWRAVKDVLHDQNALAAALNDILRRQAPELAAVVRFEPDMPWMAAVIQTVDRHSPECFADVFEIILVDLARSNDLRTGEFHTPRSVADLMVALVQPRSQRTVYDPACGSGGILAAVARRTDGLKSVVGRALNPTALALALSALFLHGQKADILLADAMISHPRFDFVLSNPPFNVKDPSHGGNFAWIQMALDSLAVDGRAAIILPAAAAGSAREAAQRGRLVEADLLEAVITLPAQLFPGTDVAPHIWVLTKRKRPASRGQILLIDATRAGKRRGRGDHELIEPETADIVDCLMTWRAFARVDVSHGDDRVSAAAISSEDLAKSGYVVAPGRHIARKPAAVNPPKAQALLEQYAELREESDRLDALLAGAASFRPRTQGPCQDDPFGGKVPSSWRIVPLATLLSEATEYTGKPVLTGPSGKALPRELHTDAGVPVVMPQDIGDNTLSADRAFRVAEQTARRLEQFRLRPGDIVLARRGEMGRRALVRADHEGWLFGTGCIRVRCGDVVDPGYLAAYLGRPQVREWLNAHAQGTTALLSITATTLGNLQIVLPPREVQTAVRNADEFAGRRLALAAEAIEVITRLRGALLAEIAAH
ncbi:MAG: N-6 DNA methylase [Catenulispora sp.]|nr:N-6 DNA methylase [Catenulispora sp.]